MLIRATPVAPEWHSLDAIEVMTALASSSNGLDHLSIRERLDRDGSNSFELEHVDAWWAVLLRQFRSLIIVLLLVSTVLMAALGRAIDAAAIVLAILVDVILGFIQELRAGREVAALRKLDTRHCHVRREGVVLRIPADQVVVGDIVVLESGERVPADTRWIVTNGLRIDESILTGESLPVEKDARPTPSSTPLAEQSGMGWSGTLVIAGRAEGVVVATGRRTVVGEIKALVGATDTPTPLQRVVRRFETRVGLVALAVTVIVLTVELASGSSFTDAFLAAVALAIAAIPEGLPVVLTVALSLGVTRMARRRAVVRTLPAVEALGSTTLIAADKTGTLTVNRMTVERVWTPVGEWTPGLGPDAAPGSDTAMAVRVGALSNDAHFDAAAASLLGDPMDVAIAGVALGSKTVTPEEFEAEPLAHAPYEPAIRCSATVRPENADRVLMVKGAVDLLLATAVSMRGTAGSQPVDRDRILAAHDEMATSGMRVLAVARRLLTPDEDAATATTLIRDLELVGLVGMSDPPRAGVKRAIADCRHAGIAVVMLTGDHPATASAIAERLELGGVGTPVTGAEIEKLDDEAVVARIRSSRIAARVTPRDKLRIVRALEAAGEVVAVTGDGVNDAPALRAASIGVAMGKTGTDVAREAADIVLLDDAFSTIVSAVREGRITFAAAQKATFFLVSTGFAALLAVAGNLALGGVLIFVPAQMIWFNLVSNGVQDVGLAFERGEGDELERRPRSPKAGLLSRTLWVRAALTAIWMAAVVVAAFHLMLASGSSLEQARTMALTVFAFLNLFQTFTARSERVSVFRQAPWSNPVLLIGALGSLVVHVVAVETVFGWTLLGFTPLSWQQWLIAAGAGTTVLVVAEIDKLRTRNT